MIVQTLQNMFQPRNSIIENLGANPSSPQFYDALGGSTSSSGEHVTHENSLDLAAVWQAVATISGDIASLPINFYKRNTEDDSREIDYSPRINYIVDEQANNITSANEFWRRLMVHALLWGNGYAFIDRAHKSKSGKPQGLINLHPDFIHPVMDDTIDKIAYVYKPDNDSDGIFLHDFEVLHVKGLSINNGVALDWLQHARDTLGLGMSIQRQNSKFFQNGMQLGGILMIPPTYTQEARDNLEEGWQKRLGDPNNAFKVAILRDGAKYAPIVAKPEEGQMKESKEENVRDVARFFNLPGAKLNLVDSVSYNSTEQLQLIYLTTTLRHWMAAITGETDLKMRTQPQKDRRTHFFDYNPDAILKTDSKTREEILEIRRRNMIVTANEWRKDVNLPQSLDETADTLFNPNTRDTSEDASDDDTEPQTTPVEPDEDEETEEQNNRFRPLVESTLYRASYKVTQKLNRLAKKPNKLADYVDSGWKEDYAKFEEEISIPYEAINFGHNVTHVTATFFHDLINEANLYLDPPYKASELITNIETLTNSLKDRISDLTNLTLSSTMSVDSQ